MLRLARSSGFPYTAAPSVTVPALLFRIVQHGYIGEVPSVRNCQPLPFSPYFDTHGFHPPGSPFAQQVTVKLLVIWLSNVLVYLASHVKHVLLIPMPELLR